MMSSAQERSFGSGASEQLRTMCPECSRHFSAEARFCPFDGSLLVVTSMRSQKDPLVGQLVDARYEVLNVVGEGGMGVVYRVRHATLRREFGLKVLRRDLAKDTNLCTRFIREARAAAAVDHPGVVQITDFGALPSGQPYFVMELLQGESLTHLLTHTGRLPLTRFVAIVEQLVDALEAAHGAQVVHRDLKPDNVQVLTDTQGRDLVKVLDFGLARVGGESRITKQGFVFGTPHYMSPEQAQGDSVDHRADIYALGVLMYEMITGRLPFDADSYMGVLTQHIHTAPERPSKVLGTSDLGELETLILRCMEKRPERRFASLEEFRSAWDSIIRSGPSGIVVAPRRFWRSPLSKPRSRANSSPSPLSGWRCLTNARWFWPLLIAQPALALAGMLLWQRPSPAQPATAAGTAPATRSEAAELPLPVPTGNLQAAGPEAPSAAPAAAASEPPRRRGDGTELHTQSASSLSAKPRSRATAPQPALPAASATTPWVSAPVNSPQSVPTSEIVDPWAASESL